MISNNTMLYYERVEAAEERFCIMDVEGVDRKEIYSYLLATYGRNITECVFRKYVYNKGERR